MQIDVHVGYECIRCNFRVAFLIGSAKCTFCQAAMVPSKSAAQVRSNVYCAACHTRYGIEIGGDGRCATCGTALR